MLYENVKNTKISGILKDYEHYGYMTGADFQAFKEYYKEVESNYEKWNFYLLDCIEHGDIHYAIEIMAKCVTAEYEQLEYANRFLNPHYCVSSCYYMNGLLIHLWDMECSGYSNNPFFDFQKLVKMVNAYWKIENPYKAPNKIAYGWKFSMEKADLENGYYSKSWRLYMWGCIKNYLIKNGVEFTKEESLKVRKIVGLVDIYDILE